MMSLLAQRVYRRVGLRARIGSPASCDELPSRLRVKHIVARRQLRPPSTLLPHLSGLRWSGRRRLHCLHLLLFLQRSRPFQLPHRSSALSRGCRQRTTLLRHLPSLIHRAKSRRARSGTRFGRRSRRKQGMNMRIPLAHHIDIGSTVSDLVLLYYHLMTSRRSRLRYATTHYDQCDFVSP